MSEPALVIIKPDGISKQLVGSILTKFGHTGLEMIGIHITKTSRAIAKEHYKQLGDKPFFDQIVSYLAVEYHLVHKLIAVVYYGRDAIKKCRLVAGATNPEEATPQSVRGAYGRIRTDGLYENVVHVSSTPEEAEREVKLWFEPDDLTREFYPTKIIIIHEQKKKVWT